MANTKDVNQAYKDIIEFMDLLTDDQVDHIELRATQVMWDRYHRDSENGKS